MRSVPGELQLQRDADRLLDSAVEAIKSGDFGEAQQACSDALSILTDTDSRRAEALSLMGLALAESDPVESLRVLRSAVDQDATEPNFRINLGRTLIRFGDISEGIGQLQKASQQSRYHPAATIPLADAYINSGQPDEANKVLTSAIAVTPSIPLFRRLAHTRYLGGDLYGADDAISYVLNHSTSPIAADLLTSARLAMELLDFDRARKEIDPLIAAAPTSPQIASTAIQLYVWQGHLQKALDVLFGALAANPDDHQLLALALTHDETLAATTLARAEHIATSLPDDSETKTSLLFPLARYYDRKQEHEHAWRTMLLANRLTRLRRVGTDRIDADALWRQMNLRIDNSLSVASSVDVKSENNFGHAYIVSAPRTGSSLLQSILAAHDGVASVGERGALLGSLLHIADNCDSASFASTREQLQRADIAGLTRLGANAPLIVDKTPHNFFVLPLINAVHPGSRFVNVTRDPRDVAVSMLFHDFRPVFVEATHIDLIESMLAARVEGTKKYADAGIELLPLRYEAFVDGPATEGRRIARALDIDWDESTLEPARRYAAVSTFSAGQVRRPIERSSDNQWMRFAPFMEGSFEDPRFELAE